VSIPCFMTATLGLLAEDRRTTVVDDETGHARALREAVDSDTSPWRLAALANHVDPHVRMAVGANPSAPALTILRLRRDLDPRVRVVLSAYREIDR